MWAHLQDEPPDRHRRPPGPARRHRRRHRARAWPRIPRSATRRARRWSPPLARRCCPTRSSPPAAVTRAHGSPRRARGRDPGQPANVAPPLAAPPLAAAPRPAAAPPLAAPTASAAAGARPPARRRGARRLRPARAGHGAGRGCHPRGRRRRRADRQGRCRQAGARRRQGRRQRPARADLQGALGSRRRRGRRPGPRADAPDRPAPGDGRIVAGRIAEAGAGPPARRRPGSGATDAVFLGVVPGPAPHRGPCSRRAPRDRVRGAHRPGPSGDRLHERRGLAVRGGRGDAAPALGHGPRRPSQPGLRRRPGPLLRDQSRSESADRRALAAARTRQGAGASRPRAPPRTRLPSRSARACWRPDMPRAGQRRGRRRDRRDRPRLRAALRGRRRRERGRYRAAGAALRACACRPRARDQRA